MPISGRRKEKKIGVKYICGAQWPIKLENIHWVELWKA